MSTQAQRNSVTEYVAANGEIAAFQLAELIDVDEAQAVEILESMDELVGTPKSFDVRHDGNPDGRDGLTTFYAPPYDDPRVLPDGRRDRNYVLPHNQ